TDAVEVEEVALEVTDELARFRLQEQHLLALAGAGEELAVGREGDAGVGVDREVEPLLPRRQGADPDAPVPPRPRQRLPVGGSRPPAPCRAPRRAPAGRAAPAGRPAAPGPAGGARRPRGRPGARRGTPPRCRPRGSRR